MDIYQIQKPSVIKLPVVLSIPHAGTYFPDPLRLEFKPNKLPPDDTDWFVDQLYNLPLPGIPLIRANYSRWVIDLNRNPDNKPLYNDGRIITGLCTATDFSGEPIYNDERKRVTIEETNRRATLYFDPYHHALQQLMQDVKTQFGVVLLLDCHSIRRYVPSIYSRPFPDLILGSADGTSASQSIIDKVWSSLKSSPYSVSHNHPFKGGYITRYYGKPNRHQHALQLEMAKPLYMNDSEKDYEEQRASKVREWLIKTISAVGEMVCRESEK